MLVVVSNLSADDDPRAISEYLFSRTTEDYVDFLNRYDQLAFEMGNGLNFLGFRALVSPIRIVQGDRVNLYVGGSVNFSFSVFPGADFSVDDPDYDYDEEIVDPFVVVPGGAFRAGLSIDRFSLFWSIGTLYWTDDSFGQNRFSTFGQVGVGFDHYATRFGYQYDRGELRFAKNRLSSRLGRGAVSLETSYYNGGAFSNDVYYANLMVNRGYPTGLVLAPSIFHITPDRRDFGDYEATGDEPPSFDEISVANVGVGLRIGFDPVLRSPEDYDDDVTLLVYVEGGSHSMRADYFSVGLLVRLGGGDMGLEFDYRFGLNDFITFKYLPDSGTASAGGSRRESWNHQFIIRFWTG